MITDKAHRQQIEVIHETYRARIEKMEARHYDELKQARDLNELLGKFASGLAVGGGIVSWNDLRSGTSFPDNIPQYVYDFFGGKVIKQEATKVVEIAADGAVRTGLSKQPADAGYEYKLIRL